MQETRGIASFFSYFFILMGSLIIGLGVMITLGTMSGVVSMILCLILGLGVMFYQNKINVPHVLPDHEVSGLTKEGDIPEHKEQHQPIEQPMSEPVKEPVQQPQPQPEPIIPEPTPVAPQQQKITPSIDENTLSILEFKSLINHMAVQLESLKQEVREKSIEVKNKKKGIERVNVEILDTYGKNKVESAPVQSKTESKVEEQTDPTPEASTEKFDLGDLSLIK